MQDKHTKSEGLIEKLKMKHREELENREDEISSLKTKKVEQDRTIAQLQ